MQLAAYKGVKQLSDFSKKCLNLYSEDEWKSWTGLEQHEGE